MSYDLVNENEKNNEINILIFSIYKIIIKILFIKYLCLSTYISVQSYLIFNVCIWLRKYTLILFLIKFIGKILLNHQMF